MDITKEALEYLMQLSDKEIISGKNGHDYIKSSYTKITSDRIAPLCTNTLHSVVDYIKNTRDVEKYVVHIESPKAVNVYSELYDDDYRDCFLKATAFTSDVRLNEWLDMEMFNLNLQANFKDTEDKKVLLAYIGNIKDEKVKKYSDDGISQTVTVRQGVATVAEAILPNPVILAPYRTFPEIEQPESEYIFRMKDGPLGILMSSDGNLWKIKAIENIRRYLKENLKNATDRVTILG